MLTFYRTPINNNWTKTLVIQYNIGLWIEISILQTFQIYKINKISIGNDENINFTYNINIIKINLRNLN